MNKTPPLILIAAADLAMTATHAAEPKVLIPPHRHGVAHAPAPVAVSGHKASATLETAATPGYAAFNAHVAP